MFSETGILVEQAAYSTYGTPSIQAGNVATPFGFQDAYTDPSGLVYLVNRTYTPGTAQFLSVDPMLTATGQPYAMEGDNPLNHTDPLGTMIVGARSQTAVYTPHTQSTICTSGCPSDTAAPVAQPVQSVHAPPRLEPGKPKHASPSTSTRGAGVAAKAGPPAPSTGNTTEVPSQVETYESYKLQKDCTNLCRVGFTISGAGSAGSGADRVISGLGHGLEDFGRTLEQTGEADGPPTDGLSYIMLFTGLGLLGIGGIAIYFGNNTGTCSQ